MKRVRLQIEKALAGKLQCMLDSGEQVSGEKECAVLHEFTANFGDGIEADIKVCNGDSGPWIDAVLFDGGQELLVLEPEFERVLGEYTFRLNDEIYTVELHT